MLTLVEFESKLQMMGFHTTTADVKNNVTASVSDVVTKSTCSSTSAASKTSSILAIATAKTGSDVSTPSVSKVGGSSLYSLIKKQSIVNTPSAVKSIVPKPVMRDVLPDEDAGHDSFDSDNADHDEVDSKDLDGAGVERRATVKFASSVDEFVAPICTQSVNSSIEPPR
jgi:hypothetical protein